MLGSAEWRLRRRFAKAAKLAPQGALRDFYDAGMENLSAPVEALEMIAIDLETDGLDFESSAILEAGMVTIAQGRIGVDSARRLRLRPPGALSESSVVVHRITDDALAAALPEEDAIPLLLAALAGKPLVAHFADIEMGFLDAACRRVYGAPFVAPFICTMQLESRWFPRTRAADGLRLGKLRAGYHLPAYSAHDGVTDAFACAELLLAQIAHRTSNGLVLRDLLRR